MVLNEAEEIGYEGRRKGMAKGRDKWGMKRNKMAKRQDKEGGEAGCLTL
jgi:hypothetical protein